MDFRKYGETYYVRLDRGEEIVSSLLAICEKEQIPSAVFSGIGGCGRADVQTFLPETGTFETERLEGMLELVSLNGNVTKDEAGQYAHHTHALFAYKEGDRHCVRGGHIRSVEVLYTAEIELRPVTGGEIRKKFDPETGTGFWDFQ